MKHKLYSEHNCKEVTHPNNITCFNPDGKRYFKSSRVTPAVKPTGDAIVIVWVDITSRQPGNINWKQLKIHSKWYKVQVSNSFYHLKDTTASVNFYYLLILRPGDLTLVSSNKELYSASQQFHKKL